MPIRHLPYALASLSLALSAASTLCAAPLADDVDSTASLPHEQSQPAGVQPSTPAPSADDKPAARAPSSDKPSTDARSASAADDKPPLSPAQALLADALSAPPPKRSSYAKTLLRPDTASDNLSAIDEWIENTGIDHPHNLILKDVLAAMPASIAGPRIAALALKSRDPNVQNSYARWLSKYPEAYAFVLVGWMKQNDGNPPQMLRYLDEFIRLKPRHAMRIWAQLRANYPIADLGGLSTFGLQDPLCTRAAIDVLRDAQDEISKLRLARAIIQCQNHDIVPREDPPSSTTSDGDQAQNAPATADDVALLRSIADGFHASSLPSRRIVALDLYALFFKGDSQVLEAVKKTFEDAKNTTERSFALRALATLDPDRNAHNKRLIETLTEGDEILRLESAAQIAQNPDAFDTAILRAAFDKELWPETQSTLYTAIAADVANPNARYALQESILLDATRAESLRKQVLGDIAAHSPQKLTVSMMAQIQSESEPKLDLIASIAEVLYQHRPDLRPDLRNWLNVQAPFERRIMATFARFVQIDKSSNDDSARDTMHTICGAKPVQDGILRTCLDYYEDRQDLSKDEKDTVERLKSRQSQIRQMLGFDFQ